MQVTQSKLSMKLEIVTPERLIFSDTVNFMIAPGIEGVLGIYPHHCPLLTILQSGELQIYKDDDEIYIAIGGGFMEVRKDKIIVLADVAERDDEISEQKAIEAKKRAEKMLSQQNVSALDKAEILESLRLEMIRLNIVEKRKKRKTVPRFSGSGDDHNSLDAENR